MASQKQVPDKQFALGQIKSGTKETQMTKKQVISSTVHFLRHVHRFLSSTRLSATYRSDYLYHRYRAAILVRPIQLELARIVAIPELVHFPMNCYRGRISRRLSPLEPVLLPVSHTAVLKDKI